MNFTDTKKLLAILRAAYPAFYSKMRDSESAGIVNVWQSAFSDIPSEYVTIAVQSLIKTHSGYPPDIAAVHTEIKTLLAAATGEPTDEELWLIYKHAVQESGYRENEIYDNLPPILQRYCGTARTLYEHAMMPMDTFNSVIHGQFLKQIPLMRQRQEYRDSLPEGVREMICGMAEKKALPKPEQKPTPQELNDKVNKITKELAALPPPNPEYVPISAEEREKRKQKLMADIS